MRPLTALVLPVVLTLVPALAGCKRAQEKAGDKAGEQPAGGDLQVSGESLTVTTDAGTVAVGDGTKLPDDFPKDIPVYAGAKLTMATKAGKNGRTAWTLTLDTGDSHDKVAFFYASALKAFKRVSAINMGVADMSVWQSAQYDVTLMIATSTDQQTHISMTVALR